MARKRILPNREKRKIGVPLSGRLQCHENIRKYIEVRLGVISLQARLLFTLTGRQNFLDDQRRYISGDPARVGSLTHVRPSVRVIDVVDAQFGSVTDHSVLVYHVQL